MCMPRARTFPHDTTQLRPTGRRTFLAGVLLSACAGSARSGSPDAPRFTVSLGGRENLRGWGDQAVAACRAWSSV